MFGNVIFDLIELACDSEEDTTLLKERFYKVLGRHFSKNAYKSFACAYYPFNIRFHPSRYFSSIDDIYSLNDTNLETPSLEDLSQLFQELNLTSEITSRVKVRGIHLCKNVLLNEIVSKYIPDVEKLNIKSRLNIRHQYNNGSIEFFTVRNNQESGDTCASKRYILYDKLKELGDKIKNPISKLHLKTPLNEEDKIKLGKNYNYLLNEILITDGLNIGRFEIKYVKNKVSDVAKYFGCKELYLSDIIDNIENGSFYMRLNQAYVEDLKQNLFIDSKIDTSNKIYTLIRKARGLTSGNKMEIAFIGDKEKMTKYKKLCKKAPVESTVRIDELKAKLLY